MQQLILPKILIKNNDERIYGMKKLMSLLGKAIVCVIVIAVGVYIANTVSEKADPWKDKIPETLTDIGSPYKFYYEELEDIEKHAYNEILSNIYSMPEKVRIPQIDGVQLDKVFTALLADNPDLFFVGRRCTLIADNWFTYCSVEYYIDNETYIGQKAELEAVCNEFISSLPDSEDEFLTELEIHDFIVKNCVYKLEEEEFVYSSSYGALVNGEAACEGYSKAAKLLFDLAGMESAVVSGVSDNNEDPEGPHMWNAVKVNGDFYYLDCTWDDPVSKNGEEILTYAYFNLNDEMISQTHSDFSYDFNCTATAENYFVKSNRYFETYGRSDEKAVSEVIADELNSGGNVVQLRFGSEESFDEAISELIDSKRFYNVLKRTKEKTDVKFSTDSVSYFADSELYLLTFIIKT